MNISKINSTPAFRGYITVKDIYNKVRTFETRNIFEVKKYGNGTVIKGITENDRVDCFVNNRTATYQDIAAAYNMAKNSTFRVDLTSSGMY